MNLPADLREGWYWCQWADGPPHEIVYIRKNRIAGEWRVQRINEEKSRPVEQMLPCWTALEPVAPPSWERGE